MSHTPFGLLLALLAGPALAQTFPPLTGRVVDAANLLSAEQEAALSAKLEQLETGTGRQLVVATLPSLQDYPIEDYGYRLGRAWGIGQKEQNNGIMLLVAPNERKVRIEVGYGLEPYVTDALASTIVREQITPRFRENDYPGGIAAGVDALIAQLQLPEDQAQARQAEILKANETRGERRREGGGFPLALIFWLMVAGFVILSMRRGRSRGMSGGKRFHRRRDGGSDWPVWLWVASEIASNASRGSGGSGGGWGGGDWGGGGGGGFSGGGGSFGGGGASGDW